MSADPLSQWVHDHVLAAAAEAFAVPRTIESQVRCPACCGTAKVMINRRRPKAGTRPCARCGGKGGWTRSRPNGRWRSEVNARLRSAGLDPRCFGDDGKLKVRP